MKNQLSKSTAENLVKIVADVKTASESLETNLMLFKELSDNLASTLANIYFPPKISLPHIVTNYSPKIDLSDQVNLFTHKSPDYGSRVISVDVKRRVYTICGESLYKALASDEKTVSISATFQND